jgi:hypothetical protein
MTLAQRALEIAISQLGVEEHPRGSNRGPEVDLYIISVGLNPAGKYSWCMAFIYWCYQQASKEFGIANPMYKTGGVLEQYRQRYKTNGVKDPQPGDIAILDYGEGKGHTYIVETVHPDKTDGSVEGNTNDDGSREGYEVCRRKRLQSKVKIYLRF